VNKQATLFTLPAETVPANFISPARRAELASCFASYPTAQLLHYRECFSVPAKTKDDHLAGLLCIELIDEVLLERSLDNA